MWVVIITLHCLALSNICWRILRGMVESGCINQNVILKYASGRKIWINQKRHIGLCIICWKLHRRENHTNKSTVKAKRERERELHYVKIKSICNHHNSTILLYVRSISIAYILLSVTLWCCGYRSTYSQHLQSCPCWKTVSTRLICTGFELMGRECSPQEMEVLMSPSVFCLLGNNHGSPSNILSIRCCRLELPLYPSREIEYCRVHWTVNKITFQHLPTYTRSHLFNLQKFNPMSSWRQKRAVQYAAKCTVSKGGV